MSRPVVQLVAYQAQAPLTRPHEAQYKTQSKTPSKTQAEAPPETRAADLAHTVDSLKQEVHEMEARIVAHMSRSYTDAFYEKYKKIKQNEKLVCEAAQAARDTCEKLAKDHARSVDEFQAKQNVLEQKYKTLSQRYNKRINAYEDRQKIFEKMVMDFIAKKEKRKLSWFKKPSVSTASAASDLPALLAALNVQP